jgi:autoinducer 2-degrading protein
MLVQVVHLEVQPQHLQPFLREVTANVRASRQEPGVLQFDLLQLTAEPQKFMLYEVYCSPEDLEAHRLTPHFQRWVEVGVPLLHGDRQRAIYQIIDPAA